MTNETNTPRYSIAITNNNGVMDTVSCNDISLIHGISCDMSRLQKEYMRGGTVALVYDNDTHQRFCFRDVDW